jgi:ATP-dependent RNA helicase RhlE
MLDMGFVHDVKRILKLLPAKKTEPFLLRNDMPKEIAKLASEILINPVKSSCGFFYSRHHSTKYLFRRKR